jgi:exosortase A
MTGDGLSDSAVAVADASRVRAVTAPAPATFSSAETAVRAARAGTAPGWPATLAGLAVLLAALLLLYRDTGLAMVGIWSRSDTFAHAFTVPPIVAWLIWRRRAALSAQTPRASRWVLLPIGFTAFVWLLGDLATTNAVTQLAFTALLVLTVVAVFGPRVASTIAFPLGFLFFMVPIGEFVMPKMMDWTADFTVFALHLSGIPVYREGLDFVIPSGNWSVAEACSGVRYLIASVMVGVLFAYLNYRSLRRRLAFVAVAFVVPIVANWVRAYLIVVTGHLSGNTLAVGADHLIYGWVFFGIVITAMFVIGARWSEAPADPALPMVAPGALRGAPGLGRRVALVAGAAVLLLALPQLLLHRLVQSERVGAPSFALPAEMADGWHAAAMAPADWTPGYEGAVTTAQRSYTRAGETVGVYVGYYRRQDATHKLVSSTNALAKGKGAHWSEVAGGSRTFAVDDRSVSVRTAQLRGSRQATDSGATRLAVRQVYWVNGRYTASDRDAKGWGAVYRLLGRGDDAAVVIAYAVDEPGGGANVALDHFVGANLPLLARRFAETRDAAPTLAGAAARPAPGSTVR